MQFIATRLEGAYLIDTQPHLDERGAFERLFCAREFAALGLEASVAQCNLSSTRRAGTLRGLHFQVAPSAETKLVRCVRGAIYDVIVDLRPDSATYLEHVAIELSAAKPRSLYVPAQFAHGFQTLTDDVDVLYMMGNFYAPELARGLRFNDPRLGVQWPLLVTEISERDATWPWLDAQAGVRP